MISRRQIISGSAGLIFAIFSRNESVLGADDQSGPLFFDISRDVAMATDLVKKWQTPHFRRSGIQERNGITPCIAICMI